MKAAMPPAAGVAVLDRAFSILNAFGPDDHRLSLAELAVRTGLYKSTILRIAQSLAGHRFLVRYEDGYFQIGPAPLALAAIFQRSVRLADLVLPAMQELAQRADDGASFYIRVDDRRICLHRVDSRHAIKDHVREGDSLPLERGSGGRVLLAYSGVRGALYARIRRDGYYISAGERDPETNGISAPVFGAGDRLIGAITIAGPAFRMTEAKLMELRIPLLTAVVRTSLGLGANAAILQSAVALASKHKSALASPRRAVGTLQKRGDP